MDFSNFTFQLHVSPQVMRDVQIDVIVQTRLTLAFVAKNLKVAIKVKQIMFNSCAVTFEK